MHKLRFKYFRIFHAGNTFSEPLELEVLHAGWTLTNLISRTMQLDRGCPTVYLIAGRDLDNSSNFVLFGINMPQHTVVVFGNRLVNEKYCKAGYTIRTESLKSFDCLAELPMLLGKYYCTTDCLID